MHNGKFIVLKLDTVFHAVVAVGVKVPGRGMKVRLKCLYLILLIGWLAQITDSVRKNFASSIMISSDSACSNTATNHITSNKVICGFTSKSLTPYLK